MWKKLALVLMVPAILAGCYDDRPRAVSPQYVATCPEGYRYDANNNVCRRRHHEREGERGEGGVSIQFRSR